MRENPYHFVTMLLCSAAVALFLAGSLSARLRRWNTTLAIVISTLASYFATIVLTGSLLGFLWSPLALFRGVVGDPVGFVWWALETGWEGAGLSIVPALIGALFGRRKALQSPSGA